MIHLDWDFLSIMATMLIVFGAFGLFAFAAVCLFSIAERYFF